MQTVLKHTQARRQANVETKQPNKQTYKHMKDRDMALREREWISNMNHERELDTTEAHTHIIPVANHNSERYFQLAPIEPS